MPLFPLGQSLMLEHILLKNHHGTGDIPNLIPAIGNGKLDLHIPSGQFTHPIGDQLQGLTNPIGN